MANYWKHHEVFDGTYTIDDLLDIHELMLVKMENEKRFQESREK
jgi:hypothetical protein